MSHPAARRRSLARYAAAIAALGAVVAVVAASPQPRARSHHALENAREWLSLVEFDYARSPDWKSLVEEATFAGVVRVVEIDTPHWNSRDGLPWDGDLDTPPEVYSSLRAEVVEQWAGREVDRTLDLIVFGEASKRYEGFGIPGWASVSGGFDEGGKFAVLLRRDRFLYQGGSKPGWTLAAQFEGNWRVSGDRAIGSDLSRSMALAELKRRITRSMAEGG